MFKRIKYGDLNPRQKENHNFQKVASVLADYGYNCIRLSDDWQGADFIAYHIDGDKFIKVQLKGRLTIQRRYNDKDVYIAFNQDGQWYLYPHDQLQAELLKMGLMSGTESWEKCGSYTWPRIPKKILEHMNKYAIPPC